MREEIAGIRWNLHRTLVGAWVVFGSLHATFTSADRNRVEKWLILHGGLRQEELERLFHDAEERGVAGITVPVLRGAGEQL
jgi:hypothetical protein